MLDQPPNCRMDRDERVDADDQPVGRDGGRRPSILSMWAVDVGCRWRLSMGGCPWRDGAVSRAVERGRLGRSRLRGDAGAWRADARGAGRRARAPAEKGRGGARGCAEGARCQPANAELAAAGQRVREPSTAGELPRAKMGAVPEPFPEPFPERVVRAIGADEKTILTH